MSDGHCSTIRPTTKMHSTGWYKRRGYNPYLNRNHAIFEMTSRVARFIFFVCVGKFKTRTHVRVSFKVKLNANQIRINRTAPSSDTRFDRIFAAAAAAAAAAAPHSPDCVTLGIIDDAEEE